jgi:hypothetical protein
MTYRDKNGKNLKVGDWVIYPWGSGSDQNFEYFCDTIKAFGKCDYNTTYVHGLGFGDASTTYRLEKVPKNKKKRNEIFFLRKLEQ